MRKYRVDKINKESSFNKSEGILSLLLTCNYIVLSAFYSKGGLDAAKGIAVKMLDKNAEFTPNEIFAKMKEMSKKRKLKESVEAIIRLGVDPKKGD